jgi:DNA-binding NarL/FixJ family response regulator
MQFFEQKFWTPLFSLKDGKTTKQIASLLDISPRTVDAHRNRITKKLMNSQKVTGRYLLKIMTNNEK